MRQDLEIFRDMISGYDRKQLLSLSLCQYQELCELKIREAANSRIYANAQPKAFSVLQCLRKTLGVHLQTLISKVG